MSGAKGCFKPVLLGCGVIFAIGILFTGISALIAWNSIDEPESAVVESIDRADRVSDRSASGRGRVILNLAQAEFEILPAAPGKGVSIEALYDEKIYELKDRFVGGAEEWEYRVDFRRTMPALQALFRSLMVDGGDSYFRVYLPPDARLDLVVTSKQGGLVTEIGGLWLHEAEFICRQGGFVLNVGRPLKEPMDFLSLRGAMGGFNLSNLGNASPARMDIRHRMGGAIIDLDGEWRQDSDISIGVRMGGTSVSVPRDVDVVGAPLPGPGLRNREPEVPPVVLRFTVSESMGEVDFSR